MIDKIAPNNKINSRKNLSKKPAQKSSQRSQKTSSAASISAVAINAPRGLSSQSIIQQAKSGAFDNIVWYFNLVFLVLCLAYITDYVNLSYFSGILLGIAAAIAIGSLRNKHGFSKSLNYVLPTNFCILIISVVLAVFYLWRNILRDVDFELVEYTVILFLLLGLSSITLLLQIIKSRAVISFSVEQRIKMFMGGPSLALSLCVAAIFSSLTLLVFSGLDDTSALLFLNTKFLERGVIPPICLLLFLWGLILLLGKYQLSYTRINLTNNPQAKKSFLLSLWQDYSKEYKGRETRLDAKFVELLWNANETFYLFPRYINWAMPILGFIGTVLGISLAAGEIGNIVGSSSLNIGDSISSAMAPLGIAFDTTLIALSLSVILAFAYTLLQRWEEQKFLFIEDFISKNR